MTSATIEKPAQTTTLLDEYLRRHGITVAAISQDTGMEQSHVWRIVKGEREPGISSFAKLAQGLGLPMETLYEMITERTG